MLFLKNPFAFAKINSSLLLLCVLFIPLHYVYSYYRLNWVNLIDLAEKPLVFYGLFFLFCYSIVEYFITRIPVEITAFAKPVQANRTDFVPTVFDTAERAESEEPTESENSEPYKSPEQ